jgi:ectoine hydroxylase-related dioxygenase (phytanoyl-CoA dioxygenase family)
MDKWFNQIATDRRSDLSADRVRELSDAGYIVIESAFARDKCEPLAEAYDAAVSAAHPDDVSVRSSTRVHDFVNRGPHFDELYIYRPLLAACCHIIGRPFKLSTLLARTLEPGAPMQPLHVDFARDDDGWPMVGFIIMIDEFQSDNGATRFVPGSQLLTHDPGDVMKDVTADYEGQALACGPAGSMIIYNGSIWHGHTADRSGRRRRSIQGAFIRREAQSAINQATRIRPETLARIGDLAKYLLDLKSSHE